MTKENALALCPLGDLDDNWEATDEIDGCFDIDDIADIGRPGNW